MALDIVVQSLRKVELFAGLKPLQLAELARCSDRIVYRPGQSIITEGASADAAILLVKGDAVRTSGPALSAPSEPVVEGALLCEVAMLIETEYTSTVVAASMVRAIRLTRASVLGQIKAEPALADLLSRNLARRLNDMAGHLRRLDDTLMRLDQPFDIPMPAALTFALPQLQAGPNHDAAVALH